MAAAHVSVPVERLWYLRAAGRTNYVAACFCGDRPRTSVKGVPYQRGCSGTLGEASRHRPGLPGAHAWHLCEARAPRGKSRWTFGTERGAPLSSARVLCRTAGGALPADNPSGLQHEKHFLKSRTCEFSRGMVGSAGTCQPAAAARRSGGTLYRRRVTQPSRRHRTAGGDR